MQNLKIILSKSCWGDEQYFGFKNGSQHTEGYDNIEDLKEDYEEFRGVVTCFKTISGWKLIISDKENLLSSEIIEELRKIDLTIYHNDVDSYYWVFDFKIKNVWFESKNINMVKNTMNLIAWN